MLSSVVKLSYTINLDERRTQLAPRDKDPKDCLDPEFVVASWSLVVASWPLVVAAQTKASFSARVPSAITREIFVKSD